jgi:hypothetical protein
VVVEVEYVGRGDCDVVAENVGQEVALALEVALTVREKLPEDDDVEVAVTDRVTLDVPDGVTHGLGDLVIVTDAVLETDSLGDRDDDGEPRSEKLILLDDVAESVLLAVAVLLLVEVGEDDDEVDADALDDEKYEKDGVSLADDDTLVDALPVEEREAVEDCVEFAERLADAVPELLLVDDALAVEHAVIVTNGEFVKEADADMVELLVAADEEVAVALPEDDCDGDGVDELDRVDVIVAD